jgi:hypothetical protein
MYCISKLHLKHLLCQVTFAALSTHVGLTEKVFEV